ncbi:hypothetical protein Dimus_006200 [Dionaea muscipula]
MPPPTSATSSLLLLLVSWPPQASAQAPSVSPFTYINYSPSPGTVIIVVVGLLFVITAFISVYLRHFSCSFLGRTNEEAAEGRPWPSSSRGLNPAVIETFPRFLYADVKTHRLGKVDLECAVCLNEFEDHERLRLLPECSHVFHSDCIDPWLSNRATCPVCRANLEPKGKSDSDHKPCPTASSLPNLGGLESQPPNRLTLDDDRDHDGDHVVINVWRSPRLVMRSPRPDPSPTTAKGSTTRRGGGGGGLSPTKQQQRSRGKIPRSRSTGELCGQDDVERFTLRLPEAVTKRIGESRWCGGRGEPASTGLRTKSVGSSGGRATTSGGGCH